MLFLLLSWLTITLVFLAFGNIFVSLWNKFIKAQKRYSFVDSFFLGMCSVGTITMIVSLFFPINIFILSSFICITLIYWAINRKGVIELRKRIYLSIRGLTVWSKVLLGLFFLIICLWSIQSPSLEDIGLYHLQTLMWTDQYSVVPGLGNLHGRLAFNSSFLLLTALFSYNPDYYLIYFSLNGLSLFVFCSWLVLQINKSNFIRIIGIGLLFVSIIYLFGIHLSSISTDILPGILICYLLLSIIIDNDFLSRVLPLSIISIFCITLKLSSVAIILLTIFIFALQIKKKNYKTTFSILFLGCIIIFPWCIRFIILSGYLIYPFPSIDIFSFDWKIPLNMVELERDWAYIWGRIPYSNNDEVLKMSIGEWFPIWFEDRTKREIFILVLPLVSILVSLLSYEAIRRLKTYSIVLGIAICGSLFCFFTVPDIRFGWGFYLVAGILPFFLWNFQMFSTYFIHKTTIVFLYFLIMWDLPTGIDRLLFSQPELKKLYTLIYKPQAYNFYKYSYSPENIMQQKAVNVIIYSPINTDKCFDYCLPCTPYFKENLEMRGESLQSGFRIKR